MNTTTTSSKCPLSTHELKKAIELRKQGKGTTEIGRLFNLSPRLLQYWITPKEVQTTSEYFNVSEKENWLI